MKPEEKAREKIDHLLEAAGWTIQNIQELNLGSSLLSLLLLIHEVHRYRTSERLR